MKKPTQKVKVGISMPGYRIEGYISVLEGQRPSDFLNVEEQQFVALTEVKIYDWKGEFLEDREFVAVNKERVSWLSEI